MVGRAAGMDDAALEELCNSLTSLRTQKDWRNKLHSCEQVATQLLNMPDRSDSQFDKLIATTINYLLLAQSTADVDTRLHAEEVGCCRRDRAGLCASAWASSAIVCARAPGRRGRAAEPAQTRRRANGGIMTTH